MEIQRRNISAVDFGFYSPSKVEELASVEIKNLLAFDEFKNPLNGGLYDSKMGPGPYDRLSHCPTCKKGEKDCQGHFGFIKLVLPVYNLFLMRKMEKLLKIGCFSCKCILLPPARANEFLDMFRMLRNGRVSDFLEFQKLGELRGILKKKKRPKKRVKKMSLASELTDDKTRKSSKSRDSKADTDQETQVIDEEVQFDEKTRIASIKLGALLKKGKSSSNKSEFLSDLISRVQKKLKKRKARLRRLSNKQKKSFKETSFRDELIHTLIKDLLREATKEARCFSCQAPRCNIRKENNLSYYITKNLTENSGQLMSKKESKSVKKSQMLNPIEVKNFMEGFYHQNKELMDLAFGKPDFAVEDFFLEVLAVSPNRFRPDNKLGDQVFLHPHTALYTKVLSLNQEIEKLISTRKKGQRDEKKSLGENSLINIFGKWIELQETINTLFDSTQSSKTQDREAGIRQLLEKKEGLFRMKMMGKRVNYSARSVISPDPNLMPREIGVPLFMAKKLMFPERVTEANVEDLRKLVRNGPNIYPGAHFVEENGRKILLERASESQRDAIARQLFDNSENKIVYRQLLDGDALLFNRQPTLHKNSMTVHQARVLNHGLTIRFHYANCNGYNADFDGDEMNLHFLQGHAARAEAVHLALNDKQMILSTNGKPARGLVQDYVFSPVMLSLKNVFLGESEYFQLLYTGVAVLLEKQNTRGLLGLTNDMRIGQNDSWLKKVQVLPPTIFAPKKLWTGKQLFSNIFKIVAMLGEDDEEDSQGLTMQCKTRVNEQYLCDVSREDSQVRVRNNTLLTGIVDKNSVGSAHFGVLHCFFELYGPHKTGLLISAITRMCTNFLKIHGFTCGLGDLILNEQFEEKRENIMGHLHLEAIKSVGESVGIKIQNELFSTPRKLYNETQASPEYNRKTRTLRKEIARKHLTESHGREDLDLATKSAVASSQSELYNSLYLGLQCKFPDNRFSGMVLPGAKGSILNHGQVSSNLGQQTLEGQRVPAMASGKTLPCFLPYDPNPRAGGFIGDRFLTGLRPQEFYFHCMAGREGLVDTAVKTSRSGYLQRMLVKNLEALSVGYDYTVRDQTDQSIVQFNYGDDALNPMMTNPLKNLGFLLDNFTSYVNLIDIKTIKKSVETKKAFNYRKELRDESATVDCIGNESLFQKFAPSLHLGSISTKASQQVEKFISENTEKMARLKVSARNFRIVHSALYLKALAEPGDSVGAIAAQSFGEPSTQMTLNTFHLAGHGGANVTLGIPRLRELLSTKNVKNQIMTLPFKDKFEEAEIRKVFKSMQRVTLLQMIQKIELSERLVCVRKGLGGVVTVIPGPDRYKELVVNLVLEDEEPMNEVFGVKHEAVLKLLKDAFAKKFSKLLNRVTGKAKSKLKKQTVQNLFDEDLPKKPKQKSKSDKKVISEEIKIETENLDDEEEILDLIDDDDVSEASIESLNQINNKNKIEKLKQEVRTENQPQTKSKPKTEKKTSKKSKPQPTPQGMLYDDIHVNGKELSITYRLPFKSNRILLLPLVEDVLRKICVKELPQIKKVHLIQTNERGKHGKKKFALQTEGLNFDLAFKLQGLFDVSKLGSNDVQEMARVYGIEAGRQALMKEINNVFSHYGIAVDPRHLSLVADHMSFPGQLNPLSRTGIQFSQSPFLKMSFETSMKFLIDACTKGARDSMSTASANIVVGEKMKNGTGAFGVIG